MSARDDYPMREFDGGLDAHGIRLYSRMCNEIDQLRSQAAQLREDKSVLQDLLAAGLFDVGGGVA